MVAVILLTCIFTCIFLYFGVPWLHGMYSRWQLKRQAIDAKALVLTFDDGPGSRLTPLVLKILAENNAKATFFLLGKNVAGHQSIVRQIIAGGHEVCSHGYKHMHYWMVSPFRALSDVKRGWHAIDAALGNDKRGKYPFRPPYGKLNLVCLVYLLLHRAPIIYWSLDVGDTWPSSRRDKNRAASLIRKTGGAVTLAHDFDRSNDGVDSMVTDSIRLALASARQCGLCTLTVSQLLGLEK